MELGIWNWELSIKRRLEENNSEFPIPSSGYTKYVLKIEFRGN